MTERHIEHYAPEDLDRFAATIARGPYVHPDQSRFHDPLADQSSVVSNQYPEHEDRLFANSRGFRVQGEKVFVPYGPWQVENHPNRNTSNPNIDPEVPTMKHRKVPEQVQQRLCADGQTLFDQYGRPIHPNYQQLLSDPRIGLPTGIGYFWRYGENQTVDSVVHRTHRSHNPEVLLVQRRIGHEWALPGGFIDKNESATEAAYRELGEETRLWRAEGRSAVVYQNRPVGQRTTLHAWARNTVVLINPDQEYVHDVPPTADSDAIDVGWFTAGEIDKLRLFEDHGHYINIALGNLSAGSVLAVSE